VSTETRTNACSKDETIDLSESSSDVHSSVIFEEEEIWRKVTPRPRFRPTSRSLPVEFACSPCVCFQCCLLEKTWGFLGDDGPGRDQEETRRRVKVCNNYVDVKSTERLWSLNKVQWSWLQKDPGPDSVDPAQNHRSVQVPKMVLDK